MRQEKGGADVTLPFSCRFSPSMIMNSRIVELGVCISYFNVALNYSQFMFLML